MLEMNKKDQNLESPKKDKNNFDIYPNEAKNTNNLSSPKMDIKYEHQINNQFASPIPKKFKFMKMRVLIKVMAKTILQKMNQTFIAHM